ncbi:MAG: hypothetical protein QXU95_04540, partial [Candidatus Bathyarchaeia archaeon]
LIFQRFSKRYLVVSELQTTPVFQPAISDWPDSLPGCFGEFGEAIQPNSCESCRVRGLCRKQREAAKHEQHIRGR